jgi:NDP-sugar pyrophosphorylase family protein
VLPAGGFGYRMRSVSETGGVTQKALLPLPNGETLIGRLVRQYAEVGIRQFLALVNYEGRAVEEYLAGGAPWGVEVRCSYDPQETGSGRTGAMLHAMDRGLLPQDRTLVVHNGDCHVYGYPGSFPHDLLQAHLRASARGEVAATLAAVDGTPYPYTGMSIAEGRVTDVEMYPFIPVPTHTGITVLAPAALQSIREHAAASKKNFESDLFARWAREKRLAAMVISHRQWVAVDDRKSYRQFCQAVEAGG